MQNIQVHMSQSELVEQKPNIIIMPQSFWKRKSHWPAYAHIYQASLNLSGML